MSFNHIQPSDSPYGAPIPLSKRRMVAFACVLITMYFIKILLLILTLYHQIDEMLTRLKGARYFSSLYLREGYYQLPVALQDA